MEKHIWKNKTELIIFSYSDGRRYGVLVIEDDGNIWPKFPFNTAVDAEKWIQNQK